MSRGNHKCTEAYAFTEEQGHTAIYVHDQLYASLAAPLAQKKAGQFSHILCLQISVHVRPKQYDLFLPQKVGSRSTYKSCVIFHMFNKKKNVQSPLKK